jgi:Raf kinase inhibitor-like YbhB/YbcL family protein
MNLTLNCSVFSDNGIIPIRYTGEGQNISPQLNWRGVSPACKSLVLICDDPDAPGRNQAFVHWLVYNIHPTASSLPEGIPPLERLPAPLIGSQGRNSFLKIGYGGPLPPIGHGIHHYIFKLYSLNCELPLAPGASKDDVVKAMTGNILDACQLVGKFERSERKTA